MATTAGALGIGTTVSEYIPTHRQCSIEIKNQSTQYSLCNPRMHFVSGGCTVPLSAFIGSSSSDVALFNKTALAARGSVGVFTYDLLLNHTNQPIGKIAVMFSVPFNFQLYSNLYAVGVFDMTKECDQNLFDEMYYESHKSFVRANASDPCLVYEGNHVTIRATMSDSYQPVIKLQVTDKRKA